MTFKSNSRWHPSQEELVRSLGLVWPHVPNVIYTGRTLSETTSDQVGRFSCQISDGNLTGSSQRAVYQLWDNGMKQYGPKHEN